jgi:chitinase
LTEINEGLELLWRNNINPERVNMGFGFYGRSM